MPRVVTENGTVEIFEAPLPTRDGPTKTPEQVRADFNDWLEQGAAAFDVDSWDWFHGVTNDMNRSTTQEEVDARFKEIAEAARLAGSHYLLRGDSLPYLPPEVGFSGGFLERAMAGMPEKNLVASYVQHGIPDDDAPDGPISEQQEEAREGIRQRIEEKAREKGIGNET